MTTRADALLQLQGVLAGSLGLWAAEEPDLAALAGLAAEAEALAAGLGALAPGPDDAGLAAEAERLRIEVAAAADGRLAGLRAAWADERRALEALQGAYGAPVAAAARFLDRRQ